MKISNWRKKLAATMAAAGMISPAAALAANLNTNLVVNGTFESIDNTFPVGDYGATKINSWVGPGFAYHVGQAYDAGGPLAGGGDWYFTSNWDEDGVDVQEPNRVYQDIDVSTGATATAIAAGKGRVDLQAFMTSYADDLDAGVVRVDYLDSDGVSRGFSQIVDSDAGAENVWNQNNGSGAVHVGTATLRVSLFGLARTFGPDGYIDNVEAKVVETADPQFLVLEVNTNTGVMAIKNQTGGAFDIDYYEVTSANNRLSVAGWNSLKDQNLAGFPAGNGSGNGWEEGGGASAGAISESYLTGDSTSNNGMNINLGAAFLTGGAQDLIFRYGVITPPLSLASDFNGDGEVDGADVLTLQRNLGLATEDPDPIPTKAQGNANGDRAINATDLEILLEEFGTGAGTSQLVRGVVRYVTTGPIAAVPEPGGVLLAGCGLAALAAMRRRSR